LTFVTLNSIETTTNRFFQQKPSREVEIEENFSGLVLGNIEISDLDTDAVLTVDFTATSNGEDWKK
jgi:hypothetical protein